MNNTNQQTEQCLVILHVDLGNKFMVTKHKTWSGMRKALYKVNPDNSIELECTVSAMADVQPSQAKKFIATVNMVGLYKACLAFKSKRNH